MRYKTNKFLNKEKYLTLKFTLFFLSFYSFFLLGGFWSMRETLKDFSLFDPLNDLFVNFLALPEQGLLSRIIFLLARFSIIFSPILIVTITEFLLAGSTIENRIKNLSLFKIYDSGGHKFADIWFWLFESFQDKFPFIVTFLTLGSSVFYSGIQNWFNSIYESFIPISSNNISCSLIMICAILVGDLSQYLRHRLAHTVPAIWDLHELHHSPTKMTILSGGRATPLEKLLSVPFIIPISALSGLLISQYLSQGFIAPLIIYVFYISLDVIFTTVGHSSFKLIYPKPFSYIFMSPALHWLHHSDNPKHYNCNLSNTLTLWDRVFGTYKNEDHLKDIVSFGVKDTEYNKFHPLYAMLILPVIKLKEELRVMLFSSQTIVNAI